MESEKAYLIYQVQKMAKEMGRVPKQDEFCTHIPRWYIQKNFVTYNELLRQAGLETNKEGVGRKKQQ